jgi:hypothetical protein
VDRGAVVSRSVLWDHCQVGTGGLIDRCLATVLTLGGRYPVPMRWLVHGAGDTAAPSERAA